MTAFDERDAARIAAALGASVAWRGDHFRFSLVGGSHVALYPPKESREGAFVAAYCSGHHMQLHGVLRYVCGESFEEVTFIAQSDGHLSGMVVEKGGGVALYANVPREYLSADFSALGVEATMAGLALSAAEFGEDE